MPWDTKKLAILAVCAAALVWSGCDLLKDTANTMTRFREDDQEVTFTVPAIAHPACREILLDLLRGVPGVEDARPDPGNNRVVVRFFSRDLATKNIEYAIADAGFDVDDTAGNPNKRESLPAPCR